jgi:HEAT repeat protein
LGKNAQAVQDYTKNLELNLDLGKRQRRFRKSLRPQLLTAYLKRGQAYASLGKNSEALKNYSKVVQNAYGSEAIKLAAVAALGAPGLKAARATAELLSLLQDSSSKVREAVSAALIKIIEPGGAKKFTAKQQEAIDNRAGAKETAASAKVKKLLQDLKSSSRKTQIIAMIELGQLKSEQALTDLIKASKDKNSVVQSAARAAIRKIMGY